MACWWVGTEGQVLGFGLVILLAGYKNVNSSFALYKDNVDRSFEKVVLALRPEGKQRFY